MTRFYDDFGQRFDSLVVTGINPEPWKGPRVGRNGAYSDSEFTNYKEAMRAALEIEFGDTVLLDPPYQVMFYWWREIVSYKGPSGRMVTKKSVDQTNMQKALEDCMQPHKQSNWAGIIKNDSLCQFSGGLIIEQDKEVTPLIAIEIASSIQSTGKIVLPPNMLEQTADLVADAMRHSGHIDVPSNIRQDPNS